MRRLALPALLFATLCASPAGAKTKTVPLPPYAGAYQPQGVDERGLWAEMDEAERTLRDSPVVIKDAALNGYLHRVLCNTVGDDRCAGVRIYVLRVADANASMAPNGMMQIWSGMLLRVRDEAELAAVMGHEFAHFEERHSLAGFRSRRTTSDLTTWLTLGSLYGATGVAALQTNAIGGMFAFQRDQERAADVRGFRYLAASHYRAAAFPDFWRRMMAEADATAAGRGQRSTRYDRTAFFATHPTDLERTTYLTKLAATDGNDGDDGAASFNAALGPWRAAFLADQLKRNDFGGSEYLLAQLADGAWTPDLLLARAELYRMRGNPRDLVAAAGFYREAIAGGGTDPIARRGLGLVLMRSGQPEEGRLALADYLQRKPDCEDAAMIRSLIQP